MKKKENIIFIDLNQININSQTKKDSNILSNRSNASSREKKQASNFIFNKKKLSKNIIPKTNPKFNSKCFIKKKENISKQKNENRQTKLNIILKKFGKNTKRQSLSIIKRNHNSPLRLSTQGKTSPNKSIKVFVNKDKLNIPYKNSINSQRLKENMPKLNSKKNSNSKNKKNINKNENKIIPNGKNKKVQSLYIKKIDKNNKAMFVNKSKDNIINISSDNIKKSIDYCKQKILNVNNISQVMSDAKQNIYINSNEIKIKNIYHPRSPEIKRKKYIKVPSSINQANLKNKNQKSIKINVPLNYRVFNSENKFHNNYAYHEIVHKNSPSTKQNKKIKEEDKYSNLKESILNISMRNKPLFLDEFITPKNNENNNKVSNTILITDIDNGKNIFSYYPSLNSNKSLSPRNIFEENYNIHQNICCCSINHFPSSCKGNSIILSPNTQKLDTSGQFNDIDTDNEDQQTIHYFGEQMLKRNKNYNFSKINESKIISLNDIQKSELKRHNSFNDINTAKKIDIKKSGSSSIPFSNSCSKIKWRKYHKRSGYNADSKLNQNNKRFSHNIINRKKKKKLVMEKSLNEQFLCQNKIKNMDCIKEKISYCESSIIDNDSINDIIKEFEKEIEDEEKKDKISKNTSQKKNKNSLDITDKFSFLSENDNNISKYSNMSKGSTNDSKIKKRKVRYYKTKNFDMEKNCDFFINSTRKKEK